MKGGIFNMIRKQGLGWGGIRGMLVGVVVVRDHNLFVVDIPHWLTFGSHLAHAAAPAAVRVLTWCDWCFTLSTGWQLVTRMTLPLDGCMRLHCLDFTASADCCLAS
jgi:hypothetical protein